MGSDLCVQCVGFQIQRSNKLKRRAPRLRLRHGDRCRHGQHCPPHCAGQSETVAFFEKSGDKDSLGIYTQNRRRHHTCGSLGGCITSAAARYNICEGGVTDMMKKFASGVIVGTIVGAAMGMLVDPINDKTHRKMEKQTCTMFRNIGSAVDNIMSMWM